MGTNGVTVTIKVTCDGTETTQLQAGFSYTIYRVGLYEAYSLAIEEAAEGERIEWLPLVDALGLATVTRAGGFPLVVPVNSDRSAYKIITDPTNKAAFPWHPSASGNIYRGNGAWVNLCRDSNTFAAADWTPTNATKADNVEISPLVGEVTPTAERWTASALTPNIEQATIVANPSSKSYLAGLWVKNISGTYSDVTLSLATGGTVRGSRDFTLTASQGWQLLVLPSVTFGAGDVADLRFRISWAAAITNGQIAFAAAHVFETTAKTSILYPPVTISAPTLTSTAGAVSLDATTNVTGTDVLHPLTLRNEVNLREGLITFTMIPAYEITSQPLQYLFDIGNPATLLKNRIAMLTFGTSLALLVYDNPGNSASIILVATSNPNPPAGSFTWQRDVAVDVRVRWTANGAIYMSAGNGSLSSAAPAWVPLQSALQQIRIGSSVGAPANFWDGYIKNFQIIQVGAPSA
jgi:hypothetical protein